MPSRLAVFSVVEWAYATVRDWAERAGHEIVLVVTMPGTDSRPGLRHANLGSRETVLMVVPNVTDCRATLVELDVELGIVFSFTRVPDSMTSVPRHGMVNLHPSLLPAHRGPNGLRALYEGERRLGATLHRLTSEMDAGPILAQASEATPEDVQATTALEALQRAAAAVLDTGVPRALAGAPGEDQDRSAASGAPRFTDDDAVLDLALTAHLFQCKVSALVLAGIQPWVTLAGERRPLRAARRLDGLTAQGPGVVNLAARRAIVATDDAVLELELGELPF